MYEGIKSETCRRVIHHRNPVLALDFLLVDFGPLERLLTVILQRKSTQNWVNMIMTLLSSRRNEIVAKARLLVAYRRGGVNQRCREAGSTDTHLPRSEPSQKLIKMN